VHFALKSTSSIRRRAEFLHLVRTECALVLLMKNAIIACYKKDFQRTEYNMKNIRIKKNIDISYFLIQRYSFFGIHFVESKILKNDRNKWWLFLHSILNIYIML